nr:hypothetical protein [Tanacetum cinerariifolium]
MLAHVGNQGNAENQNGNVVNKNIQENVRNVLVNGNHVGCSYKDFLACNPKEYNVAVSMSWNDFKFMMIEEFCPSHEMQNSSLSNPKSKKIKMYVYGLAPQIRGTVAATKPKTIQKAMQISGALTDEAVRNGSNKKVEKRGNVGEPSKDKNGRDDNKRTKTGNAFSSTANTVGRDHTGV